MIFTVNSDPYKLWGDDWKPEHDYSKDYFTVEAVTDTSFQFNIPAELVTDELVTEVYYKINDGNWTSFNKSAQNELECDPQLTSGDVIQFKGSAERYAGLLTNDNLQDESPEEFFSNIYFNDGEVKVYGNILSLFYGDDFYTSDKYPDEFACAGLFKDNDSIGKIDCSNLILSPYTTNGCYYNMFTACEGVIIPPELPATTLAKWCYEGMFSQCASLTTAPEINGTTLAKRCCATMFYGCTSLTTAQSTLPATTLANGCYNAMFRDCTSLTTAPELPATTLITYCYDTMFRNCSNLNYIKALFTTTPNGTQTSEWLYGVSATGTFIKNKNATWTTTGASGVPTGWTVQTA